LRRRCADRAPAIEVEAGRTSTTAPRDSLEAEIHGRRNQSGQLAEPITEGQASDVPHHSGIGHATLNTDGLFTKLRNRMVLPGISRCPHAAGRR
jgi:hypothetical protein